MEYGDGYDHSLLAQFHDEELQQFVASHHPSSSTTVAAVGTGLLDEQQNNVLSPPLGSTSTTANTEPRRRVQHENVGSAEFPSLVLFATQLNECVSKGVALNLLQFVFQFVSADGQTLSTLGSVCKSWRDLSAGLLQWYDLANYFYRWIIEAQRSGNHHQIRQRAEDDEEESRFALGLAVPEYDAEALTIYFTGNFSLFHAAQPRGSLRHRQAGSSSPVYRSMSTSPHAMSRCCIQGEGTDQVRVFGPPQSPPLTAELMITHTDSEGSNQRNAAWDTVAKRQKEEEEDLRKSFLILRQTPLYHKWVEWRRGMASGAAFRILFLSLVLLSTPGALLHTASSLLSWNWLAESSTFNTPQQRQHKYYLMIAPFGTFLAINLGLLILFLVFTTALSRSKKQHQCRHAGRICVSNFVLVSLICFPVFLFASLFFVNKLQTERVMSFRRDITVLDIENILSRYHFSRGTRDPAGDSDRSSPSSLVGRTTSSELFRTSWASSLDFYPTNFPFVTQWDYIADVLLASTGNEREINNNSTPANSMTTAASSSDSSEKGIDEGGGEEIDWSSSSSKSIKLVEELKETGIRGPFLIRFTFREASSFIPTPSPPDNETTVGSGSSDSSSDTGSDGSSQSEGISRVEESGFTVGFTRDFSGWGKLTWSAPTGKTRSQRERRNETLEYERVGFSIRVDLDSCPIGVVEDAYLTDFILGRIFTRKYRFSTKQATTSPTDSSNSAAGGQQQRADDDSSSPSTASSSSKASSGDGDNDDEIQYNNYAVGLRTSQPIHQAGGGFWGMVDGGGYSTTPTPTATSSSRLNDGIMTVLPCHDVLGEQQLDGNVAQLYKNPFEEDYEQLNRLTLGFLLATLLICVSGVFILLVAGILQPSFPPPFITNWQRSRFFAKGLLDGNAWSPLGVIVVNIETGLREYHGLPLKPVLKKGVMPLYAVTFMIVTIISSHCKSLFELKEISDGQVCLLLTLESSTWVMVIGVLLCVFSVGYLTVSHAYFFYHSELFQTIQYRVMVFSMRFRATPSSGRSSNPTGNSDLSTRIRDGPGERSVDPSSANPQNQRSEEFDTPVEI